MNFKTTIILFGVLLLGLGGFFLFQFLGIRTPEERKEYARWLLPSLNDPVKPVKTADFSRVVIERNRNDAAKAEKIELVKEGNNWKIVSPRQVAANAQAVTSLISQLQSAEQDPYADLSSNLAEYGLDKPGTVVTLYRDGQASVVKIGDQGPGKKDPKVYVTTSDFASGPMAVAKSRIDRVFAPLGDFRNKELLGNSFDYTGIKIAGAGQKPFELEKTESRDWKFKEPKLGVADARSVEDFAQALSQLRVDRNEDFVDDQPDAAKLEACGLTEAKAAHVVAVQKKKPDDPKATTTETLLIGIRDPDYEIRTLAVRAAALAGELFAGAGAEAAAGYLAREKQDREGGAFFAKAPGENSIVRLDAKHLKVFDKKADDLRGRALARIDTSKVDAINLTHGGESLHFRRPELKAGAPAVWDLYTATRARTKTHLDSVARLIDAVNKVELPDGKSFLDDDAKLRDWFGKDAIDLGLDKPQAELEVWNEGLERDKEGKPVGEGEPRLKEAMKSKPALKLQVGRKDEKRGVVYVRRMVEDQAPAVLAVPDPYSSAAVAPPSGLPGQPPPPAKESISLVQKVTAGYTAYRDHVLPSFVAAQASKLMLTRRGETFEADKEEKKDEQGVARPEWLLKKPVEAKGNAAAIGRLLGDLSGLSADKLLTDRATDRDRQERFGLVDKPFLKIAVTVPEKDNPDKKSEYTYVIGKGTEADGPHPNHFYAWLSAKPADGKEPESNHFVFVVPWSTVQELDAELRDGTIFAEEKTAKPVEALFTWRRFDNDKKLVETRLTLADRPEKEGSDKKVWTVPSLTVNGQDEKAKLAKLDVARIDNLLGLSASALGAGPRLNPLTTERFIVQNGKPDAKDGLDPSSKEHPPALVIEIKYDNNTSRTLTIGDRWEPKDTDYPSLAPRAFYLATASTVPNAVFVLPEFAFKDLAAGWEYFKQTEKVAQAR